MRYVDQDKVDLKLVQLEVARVCSVLVTYNPDMQLLKKVILNAVDQTSLLIIQDNSSDSAASREIDLLVTEINLRSTSAETPILLERNGSNIGLPSAFNNSARIALKNNYDLMLLLDQDSVLQEYAVERMMAVYRELTERDVRLGGIAGNNIETVVLNENFLAGFYERIGYEVNRSYREVFFTWNSGFMIPLTVWQQMGGFDERYFLDCVDQEFCFRLRLSGMRIFLVDNATISHQLGKIMTVNLLWKKAHIHGVAPFRFYYIGRDTVRLTRSFFRKFPVLMIFLWLSVAKDIVEAILFYARSDKTNSCYHFVKGMFHYFQGQSGKTLTNIP